MQANMTFDELLAQAQLLSLEDEVRLVEKLVADMRRRIKGQQQPKKAHHSILEFEGMDQESWKGVDVQEYLGQERASWDD